LLRESNLISGFAALNSTDTKAGCNREIQVEVPADVVAHEADSLVQKYQKLARIPGFRKGKVPVSLIRQRFAEDLKTEVIESLVPRFFREEADKQGLKPISQPRVTDLQIEDGKPLRFKATFEVLPEIEVSGYKELRPEPQEISVTDEEVAKALNNLLDQHATYTVLEGRSLQDGDYAQVSFQGTPKSEAGAENKPAKPVNVDDVMVEIGGSNTVREFTEHLRGARPGDTRTFEVAYPEDFADHRLAGTTFTYTVKVNGVKQKQVPELNDEFAKQVGEEFENLEALKQRIREGITAEKEHEAEHQAKDKIVEELVQRHEFPVPEALVEHQIDLRLERGLRALTAQGMRPEDLKKMDFARLRVAQRESAVKEVKVSLILDRIADLESIEVTDEDVDRELEAVARQSRQPVEEVRARLTRDGALDRIRSRIRNEKTLDFLYRRSA
jgi:trigger factor